jgi:hypothetical protein
MKKKLLFLSVIFISLNLYSQNSRNVWRMGYHQGGPEFIMDFNSGALVLDSVPQSISMFADNAGICDSSGRLLFYTNGVSVCNSLYLPMSNGDSLASFDINQGWINFGIPLTQGSLVLPDPANKKMYYLFQTSYDDSNLKSDTIFLNKIDMNQDGGLGSIVVKNQPLYIHPIVPGQLTAVKHANGRDWWLVSHNVSSNDYAIFLITTYGGYSAQPDHLFPEQSDHLKLTA